MSDEDEWSDEEDVDTPIDNIDPFVVFADTVRQLQASGAPRLQVRQQSLFLSRAQNLSAVCHYAEICCVHLLLCHQHVVLRLPPHSVCQHCTHA